MLFPGQARAGGMPMYKFVGNRILTRFQNATSGLALSEWHSGYRAYRVDALADVPFNVNSDGFDFDTEIILQLHSAGKRIAEVPIPTYYGDEICYVNGLRYARDVVRHSVRHRLGASGFGAGALARVDEPYAFKPSTDSSHGRVLHLLADRPPQRVLDVGCGPGWLAAALERQGHRVTGVDASAADGVDERMTRFVRADLDHGLPDAVGDGFDVVVAADVLEHVREPARLLGEIVGRLRPGGTLIASVPNFSHWYPRGRVALGQFDYDQRGILDATHVRFFTRRSFLRMARAAGPGADRPGAHRAAVRRARRRTRPRRARHRRRRSRRWCAPGRRCSPTSSSSSWSSAATANRSMRPPSRADVVAALRR